MQLRVQTYLQNPRCPKPVCELNSIPNLFTPNRDAYNSAFWHPGDCVLDAYYLKIYNRWGRLVYETHTQTQPWTGANVPDGTYFYQIAYTHQGQGYAKTGVVSLVR